MSGRILLVTYSTAVTVCFVTRTFQDWYDFADWLKQECLAGRDVIIRGWRYE